MKVLMVAAEMTPLVKIGGLADVMGSLPKALRAMGHDIRLILPGYQQIDQSLQGLATEKKVTVALGGKDWTGEIFETQVGEVPVYLIKSPDFYERPGIYVNPEGRDYPDNLFRFSFFCVAALEALQVLSFRPEIIHCNDWHTSLIPGLIKTHYSSDPFYQSIRTLLTIHNLGYQGVFSLEELRSLDFNPWLSSAEGYEFYGKANLLKGGILLSDAINTVSPNYARETQIPEYGWGLDEVLRSRRDDIFGIINGLDYQEWNPATDLYIVSPFSIDSIEQKVDNKLALQRNLGLREDQEVPLLGLVARLVEQKGIDLLEEALPDLLRETNLQFVVLGTGEKKYENLLQNLRMNFPQQVAVEFSFNELRAKQIYSGADMFLLPSRYEPCGLAQMICMRYGTIPIARATGGLVDTVTDYDPEGKGNGFLFYPFTGSALREAILRALQVYAEPTAWKELITRGMQTDFSWKNSALEYLALYYKITVG